MDVINVKSVYEELKKNRARMGTVIRAVRRGDLDGFTPPSTLVGEYNYPSVSVGVMFTLDENAQIYDSPKHWAENGYDIAKILSLRSLLINGKESINVKRPDARTMENITMATLSEREVQISMDVSGLPPAPLYRNDTAGGLDVRIRGFRLNENVRMGRTVEKVYYDRDLKAADGILVLYNDKVDESKISRILSVGAMGSKRKLVPTKWSITAVDDILGKTLEERVKSLHRSEQYFVKTGSFLGNRFTFIFLKGPWSFELVEAWNRDGAAIFCGDSDYEFYSGRKTYAKNTAGAYYAIKLAVLEKLESLGQQCSVIVIREITPEYFAPLGVWVVREGARIALSGDVERFDVLESAIDKAGQHIIYLKNLDTKSRLLHYERTQRGLSSFY